MSLLVFHYKDANPYKEPQDKQHSYNTGDNNRVHIHFQTLQPLAIR